MNESESFDKVLALKAIIDFRSTEEELRRLCTALENTATSDEYSQYWCELDTLFDHYSEDDAVDDNSDEDWRTSRDVQTDCLRDKFNAEIRLYGKTGHSSSYFFRGQSSNRYMVSELGHISSL